jgi:hypothetical protein
MVHVIGLLIGVAVAATGVGLFALATSSTDDNGQPCGNQHFT